MDIIRRFFADQYELADDGKVILKDKKKVSANSFQSLFDKEVSFHNKHGQEVTGFVTNIAETVEEGKPGIINLAHSM